MSNSVLKYSLPQVEILTPTGVLCNENDKDYARPDISFVYTVKQR